MTHSPSSARQRILDTATDLFSREGYRAVGTDTIIERANIAKMTLYRHFSSKNELINAYIVQTIEQFWITIEDAVNMHPDDPRGQLIAIFEEIVSQVAASTFHGCSCMNAAVEFPAMDHPAHALAFQHKEEVRDRFCIIATKLGARQPEVLAEQLLLLFNGALMQGRMQGPIDLTHSLIPAVCALIDAQTTI